MKRRSMFDDGNRMVRDTGGDTVFELVVTQKNDNPNDRFQKRQKYKNLSRSSLDEIIQFKL